LTCGQGRGRTADLPLFKLAPSASTPVFGGAAFSGTAWFDKATFSSDAVFRGATFGDAAGFGEATFNGIAVFREVTFNLGPDAANFADAVVRSPNSDHVWPVGWELHRDARICSPLPAGVKPGS
jgi:hypothetical protein